MESDLVTCQLHDLGLNYFTSLSLSFLICKLGTMPPSLGCSEDKMTVYKACYIISAQYVVAIIIIRIIIRKN